MIWAIVPAKMLEQAKTRLAQALSPEERRSLSLAMLRDVLSALRGAEHLDGVAVVTADVALAAVATELGAKIIPEQTTGQNTALEAGVDYARAQGATEVLIVSADLPRLCSATIEQLLAQARQHEQNRLVLLAPSHEGTGTNAMLQRPPGVIPLLFGVNSLQQHQQAAAERGTQVDLVQADGLAFDVDLPADLIDLLNRPCQTHTQAVLAEMRLPERLREPCYRATAVP
ncbi:MAG TPA: 2-phospho-L-lactate guanylyltransferase [Ktedonobacterales bacterium]|nr:2-phospho-L-lactate guanylyltransferase [Ktedonobacterales bacterium]